MARSPVVVIPVLSKFCNLPLELQKALPSVKFISANDGSEASINELRNCKILVADIDLIVPHIEHLKNVTWVQSTWAGVDKLYKNAPFTEPPSFTITRFSGKHFGRIMSEYVIAAIVNNERSWYTMKENQNKNEWKIEGSIHDYRSISDLTIGILGIGSIGCCVAQNLSSFGAKVWGFGRSQKNKEDVLSFLENYCRYSDLPSLLSNCDYVINILPATEQTIGLLNGDMLKHCAGKHTSFINIGRGNVIREGDLVNALNKDWIKSATLDVFEEEPLPKDSPLWQMPQVIITPHVAGVSRSKDIAEQFVENYNLYLKGEQIPCSLKYEQKY